MNEKISDTENKNTEKNSGSLSDIKKIISEDDNGEVAEAQIVASNNEESKKDNPEPNNDKDNAELKAKQEKLSSDLLKESYRYVLKLFGKNPSEDAMYATIPVDTIIKVDAILQSAKRVALIAEMQRVSLNTLTHFPCMLLLRDGKFIVLKDKSTRYNPETKEESQYTSLVSDYHDSYIGYCLNFDEEDLTLSSFFKRNNVLFANIYKLTPHFIEISVIGLIINLLGIVLPFYTMNVYDRVIPNNAFNTLFVLTLGVMIGYLFEFVFRVIRSYITDLVSTEVGKNVESVLMEKLLTMRPPGLPMTAGVKQNLFREAAIVKEFYFGRFIPAMLDIPYLLLFGVVLFIISPAILLVPIVGAIVIFIFNIFFQVPLQKAHEKLMLSEQGKSSFMAETMVGIEALKIFNGIGKRIFRWNRVVNASNESALTNSIWINTAASFSNMVMQIVSVAVVVVGVFEISQNKMSIGALIACTTLSGRVMSPIIAFAGMVVRYRSIQTTLRSLNKVVNFPSEDTTVDGASPTKKGPFEGRITFSGVDFFYAGQKNNILNKCSFDIKPGEKVAIIGRTGVGKSTITRLITGLDFQNAGRVLIDGHDIHGIHPSELRKNIGYFPQRSQFFNGTLRDNIVLTGVETSDEDYKRAITIAGVHEIVSERSGRGDDMLIAEGGTNISGGQQQVVAFARCILHDPKILIMDEPTNGMDINLEMQFMQKLQEVTKNKTFILITHKAQQLVLVDRVILLDNGAVVIDDERDKVIEMLSKGAK